MSRWFRFYDDSLNNRKVQDLPADLFKHWVNILCIASKHGGLLPSLADVAFGLRLAESKAALVVAGLAKRCLLDAVEGGYFRPHDWDTRQYKTDVTDPTNAERQQRYRDRKRVTVKTVTLPVTPAVTDKLPDTEAETDTDADADQRSLTSLQITTSEGQFVGDVKRKGWTKPRHCAVSRDKKRVFIWTDTPEWEAYAADFRAIHQQEPQPNSDGGKWFSAQGEAA
jgi:hypothetical protein